MRVTHKMMLNNQSHTISRNMQNLSEAHRKVSTGKNYSKPSDNPADVSRIMKLQVELESQKPYKNNLEEAQLWLEVSETAVNSVVNNLHRIKELTIQGTSGDVNKPQRDSIRRELHQLLESTVQSFNTSYNGKYVFSGDLIDTPPFTMNFDGFGDAMSFNYNGDTGVFNTEIAKGINIDVGVNGNDLLGDNGSGKNISDLFNDVLTAFKNYDLSNIDQIMQDLEAHLDNVIGVGAELGSKINRTELSLQNHETMEIKMKEILSKVEDVDITEAITEYKSYEMVYQANVSATSQIMQLHSLISYLK